MECNAIERLFLTTDALLRHGDLAAATVVAWAAAEAAMCRIAAQETVKVERLAPGAMAEQLYSYGVLGDLDQLDIMDKLVEARTAAIHGFEPGTVTADDIRKALALCQELLDWQGDPSTKAPAELAGARA